MLQSEFRRGLNWNPCALSGCGIKLLPWCLTPEETDRPPVANGGQDRVVQPQDSVTLNGLESKDDEAIVSYLWQMLTEYPYAVIEVRQC